MEAILEILKYVLPSVVVFFTSYYLIQSFLKRDAEKEEQEVRRESVKAITPVRLQAYERVILLLERIAPGNLIPRLSKPGMTTSQLQEVLVSTIRDEFTHNLSQQVYISPHAWELVRNAKEETIRTINSAASDIEDEKDATAYVSAIFEKLGKKKKDPVSSAISFVKKEVQTLF